MPRILFLNRYFYPDHSATSQILSDLAFRLAESGHDVHVITSRQLYDNPAATLGQKQAVRGVSIHRVSTTRFGRANLIGRTLDYLSCYRGMYRALIALARPGDIIVAKTDPPMLSVIAARAAKRNGARLINWLQDLYPEAAAALGVPLMGGPLASVLTRLRNNSLHRADANVVVSDAMAKRLADQGIARDKIAIIPNWSDDAAIMPKPGAGKTLRNSWGLAGKFVVGYSGNFGRAHDFDTMLGAAERLRGRDDIAFLMIGGGSQRDRLMRHVRDKGLDDTVRFIPYQDRDRLPCSLAVPDVHWLSLRPELEGIIFPSKFYGIAAAGRPMIALAAPNGEIAGLLAQHRCGITVPQGDVAHLAEVIIGLAADPARCHSMGQRARAMIEGNLTRDGAFTLWERVFLHSP